MTKQHAPIDDLIRELLERRAAAAQPDGLLDEIVRTAASTPQFPRGGAWSFWTPPTSLSALAGVAAIVIAIVGVVIAAPRFLGPGATGSPDLLPAIAAAGINAPTLPAGRYRTVGFEPQLTFEVPDHLWAPGFDVARQVWLRAHLPGVADSSFDEFTLVTIVNVYVDACARGTAETVAWDPSSGPDAFLDWLEDQLGVGLGPRMAVTLLGSDGVSVEFRASDTSECAGGYLALTDTGQPVPFTVFSAGTTVRYAVITLRGQTVLVATATTGPPRRDAVWAAADAVLESIEIAP